MKEQLFLLKMGVPFDVAFSLTDVVREAWVIVMRELEGEVWDWDAETQGRDGKMRKGRFLTYKEKITRARERGELIDLEE